MNIFSVVLFGIPWEAMMSVTHHQCPKQFRRCPLPTNRGHVVESSWEDPERDAEIGRKFNLWSAGCRETRVPASDPARHPVHG